MTSTVDKITKLIKFGAIAAVAAALVRRFRGGSAQPPSGSARWQPLAEPTPAPPREGPVEFAPIQKWVEPVDGECPEGHPIKGNAGSGIFHVPGGGSYDRTVPERCYASTADAEADGFRQAKR